MKMTMRWFGSGDHIQLNQIAQIPVIRGIVGTLEAMPAGAVWSVEQLQALRAEVEAAGLTLEVIESIPVPEAVKLGLPERDVLIDAYCQSIRNLGTTGIPVLCYNFMPVFDWMRTDLALTLPDGSQATGYRHQAMLDYDLSHGIEARVAWAQGFSGDELQMILRQYNGIDEAILFEHLSYFLQRVVPVAEEAGVYLALHPDDPPWSIFGLPRIVRNAATIQRILDVVDSPHNGLTFCSGSLGASAANDLPAMVRQFAGRINFVHLRNVKRTGEHDFVEVGHPTGIGTPAGDVDLSAVMQALVETGFNGPIRPDHGRGIWGEPDQPGYRPGYGLYDRALGAMYLYGLWQGIRPSTTG